jgi:hypothetical protein
MLRLGEICAVRLLARLRSRKYCVSLTLISSEQRAAGCQALLFSRTLARLPGKSPI